MEEIHSNWDIAICLGKPVAGGRPIEELYREHYVPVCSPALLHRGGPPRKPIDLSRCVLIYEKLEFWDNWFQLQGLSAPTANPQVRFDYGYQVIEAARRGFGIALADPKEIRDDIELGRSVCLFESAVSIGETIYMVLESPQSQTMRANLFKDRIKEYLAQDKSGISH